MSRASSRHLGGGRHYWSAQRRCGSEQNGVAGMMQLAIARPTSRFGGIFRNAQIAFPTYSPRILTSAQNGRTIHL
jgi:hypothetical protein